MIGTVFTLVVVGALAVALITVLRDPLVEGVTAIGRLIGGLLDAALTIAIHIIEGLTRLIGHAYGSLRDIHGERDAPYGRFWDVFIPILFIGLLSVLGYADYQLFAARIGPLIGLSQLPQASDTVLNLALGALYVVTLLVIGYALSDAYGHSPAGRSVIFGRFGDKVKKALWGSAALLAVATLALAIWTAEVTLLNNGDNFSASLFLISFSFLAVIATAIAAIPALIGVLALATVLMEIIRIVIWLAAIALWFVLTMIDKVIEAVVAIVIDIPAKLGDALYAAATRGERRQNWTVREQISSHVSHLPLLNPLAPVSATPVPLQRPEAELVPVNGAGAHPVQRANGIDAPVSGRIHDAP